MRCVDSLNYFEEDFLVSFHLVPIIIIIIYLVIASWPLIIFVVVVEILDFRLQAPTTTTE